MKKLMIVALMALAGLAGARASEQDIRPDYRYVQIQYSPDAPPVEVVAVYQINGDTYPVDRWLRIWGRDATGRWRVTGRIIRSPYGDVAVAFDGERSPAVRVQ
jgi:hypothetical protein